MIATLIVASLAVGTCCTLAAIVAEWTLSSWRGVPVRWVWLAAMLLTLTIPVVREFRTKEAGSRFGQVDVRGTSSAASPPASAATTSPAVVPPTMRDIAASTVERAQTAFPTSVRMPDISSRLLRVVAWTWRVMSLLLACVLAWSAVRMRRDVARWQKATLHGVQVLLSEDLGPALVGLVCPQIVVPPWVLQLEEAAARTILVHEAEHRQAGDSRLIAAGWLCLIAMPWHPLLWWMSRRLLRAVEFDCDARVVARGVRTAVYADQLLGALQHAGAARRLSMSTAFAEQRSQLGKRITHLLRPVPRRAVMMRVSGSVMTVVLVAAALSMPRVQVAQATQSMPENRAFGWQKLIVVDGVPRRDLMASNFAVFAEVRAMAADSTRLPALQQIVDSAKAVQLYGADGALGATVVWTQPYLDAGGRPLPDRDVAETIVMAVSATARAAEIVPRLVSGITLSPAETAAVRHVVVEHEALRRRARGPAQAQAKWVHDVHRRRDAAIRALIADPVLRAQIERNAEAEWRRPEWAHPVTLRDEVDSEVVFYFVDLPVSAAERKAAATVIEQSIRNELALFVRAPEDVNGLRALQRRRLEDVRAVIRSDATRLAFDQRLPTLLRTMPSW